MVGRSMRWLTVNLLVDGPSFKPMPRQNVKNENRHSIAGLAVSLLNCVIYQRGLVSRDADTKLILLIAHLG